jgi:uncharacterized membrane-anchored protein
MHARHMPTVNARYWLAITLASLFGTNMGDLYAHESGLGIGWGLALLALLAAAAFAAERRDPATRVLWYWLVIVIIRTGATNIADWLAYRAHVPDWPLGLGLGGLIALFGWLSLLGRPAEAAMPDTGASYWTAMLGAGVFGTAVGDMAEHAWGEGTASIALAVLLGLVLLIWRARPAERLWLYWLAVAAARTAGTAMGDFLAEGDRVNLGLPLATLITGTAFVLAVVFARRERTAA